MLDRRFFTCIAVASILVIVILIVQAYLRKMDGNWESQYSFRFPLVAGCEQEAESVLLRFSEYDLYRYRIILFNDVLLTHPDVIGYVELTSDYFETKYLADIVSTFLIACHTNEFAIAHKDDGFFGEVEYIFERLKQHGVEKIYIVDKPERLQIHYRNKVEPDEIRYINQ